MGDRLVRFMAPVQGVSLPFVLLMTGRGEVFRVALFEARPGDARAARAKDICDLLSSLLEGGMPWEALATCKNSFGAVGAIIEAACARREEVFNGQAYAAPVARGVTA